MSEETVTLSHAGYNWDCPNCERENNVPDMDDLSSVECDFCGEEFDTDDELGGT